MHVVSDHMISFRRVDLCFGCLLFIVAIQTHAETHLAVDFSQYQSGNVAGKAVGVVGAGGWIVNAGAKAEVVTPMDTFCGSQVLSFARNPGGSVHAELAGDLLLSEEGKTYICLDVLRPETKSLGLIFLSDGGATNSQAFGVYVTDTGRLAVNVQSTEMETERFMVSSADVILEEGTWYRLEFEISQSAEAGEGTFDLYISSKDAPERTLVLQGRAFHFFHSRLSRLYLSPQNERGLEVNNLGIYSRLEEFPKASIPTFPSKGMQ